MTKYLTQLFGFPSISDYKIELTDETQSPDEVKWGPNIANTSYLTLLKENNTIEDVNLNLKQKNLESNYREKPRKASLAVVQNDLLKEESMDFENQIVSSYIFVITEGFLKK